MIKKTKNSPQAGVSQEGRIISVDFFRGFIMFLLMGESTEIYNHFKASDNVFIHFLGTELSHHAWHGLHFWDLI